MNAPVPRFPLGRVVATPGAIAAMQEAGVAPADLLRRHVSGDWGDVPAYDAAENELSVREDVFLGSHVFVALALLWIIPLFALFFHYRFEKRRWAESDHG